jgi:hypothetical protein
MDLIRTAKGVNYFVQTYNELNLEFYVKHGTYTTTIETEFAKLKFGI